MRFLKLHERHLEEFCEAEGNASVQLREQVISNCPISKEFDCLLPSLEHLQLTCEVLSSLPSRFGDLINLWHLDLSCCGIRMLPDSFKQLSLLQYLNFSRCRKLTTQTLWKT